MKKTTKLEDLSLEQHKFIREAAISENTGQSVFYQMQSDCGWGGNKATIELAVKHRRKLLEQAKEVGPLMEARVALMDREADLRYSVHKAMGKLEVSNDPRKVRELMDLRNQIAQLGAQSGAKVIENFLMDAIDSLEFCGCLEARYFRDEFNELYPPEED
jgi:hypothetical protein